MRTRNTVTISLPPAMLRSVERVRKAESRTMSELMREALRTYMGARATYTPTAAERRAIARGRASESLTLEEARTYVERLSPKSRTQKPRARSRKRA